MPELIIKEPILIEPTELDILEEKVADLTVIILKKDIELRQVKKKPSIGYFRARFKGG